MIWISGTTRSIPDPICTDYSLMWEILFVFMGKVSILVQCSQHFIQFWLILWKFFSETLFKSLKRITREEVTIEWKLNGNYALLPVIGCL